VWDLNTGFCASTLLCASKCNSVTVGNASDLLCSGHFDGGVRFWDPRSGAVAHEIAALHPQSQITAVVSSPNRAT